MRLIKQLVTMTCAALCASPAFAWDHSFTRGLDLYSVNDKGTTIRLVCDPNRVFGGTETMVLIALDGNSDLNALTTIAFPDGTQITAPLVHGRLAKREMGDALWQPLLDGFRNMQRVELTVGEDARALDLGKTEPFSCV